MIYFDKCNALSREYKGIKQGNTAAGATKRALLQLGARPRREPFDSKHTTTIITNQVEYYDNILCITGSELIRSEGNPLGVMSKSYYDKLARDNKIKISRRACRGTIALVEYSSLPPKYRQAWESAHGDPLKRAIQDPFMNHLHADSEAVAFYSNYALEDGSYLPPKNQIQYSNEAAVLSALIATMNERRGQVRNRGGKASMWDEAVGLIHATQVQARFPHSLPTNEQALRRKVKKYKDEGYGGLIHSGFCNDNSRRVSMLIERLLLSLYAMPNKPFGADVYNLYNMFIKGKFQIYDKETGELFDPRHFSRKGIPVELSESTVWNYLNNPMNRAIVDSRRNDELYNSRIHRPHHHRHNKCMSLSKISMDDRDLPRKTHQGTRVKAYYSYDVASGCVIGYSYSRTKDDALFEECLRNMFQTLKINDLPMPGEVEVEHHIVNHFADELDVMFPLVRWCRAGNSQEKHAEHMNRAKKYGPEKKNHNDIGRWWARSEAYLTKSKRDGAEYVTKTYDYDVLVAEDIADIREYNNSLHPRQKLYPGKTRWDVLKDKVNRDLAQPNDAVIYKCIGNKTSSTISHNQYLQVQYGKYQLEKLEQLRRLKPNNYSVEAYWIANADGIIPEVFIYQGETYIGRGIRIEQYNTARIEWTPSDEHSFEAQSGYVSHYDATIKSGRNGLTRIGIMEQETIDQIIQAEAVKVLDNPRPKESVMDIDQLIAQGPINPRGHAVDSL